jgi:hypothetical protein
VLFGFLSHENLIRFDEFAQFRVVWELGNKKKKKKNPTARKEESSHNQKQSTKKSVSVTRHFKNGSGH